MKIRYIGPHDEVEIADLGVTVKRNHQVEVPDEFAGHAPSTRLAKAMLELHEAIITHDHPGAAALRAEIVDIDEGDGLLAQSDNWEKVVPATPKKDEVKS